MFIHTYATSEVEKPKKMAIRFHRFRRFLRLHSSKWGDRKNDHFELETICHL